MPRLTDYKKSRFIRLLLLGESKSGKTGALASLVKAGYKLFIVDFDNGLDFLFAELEDVGQKLLGNVVYQTFRDKVKLTPGGDIVPKARPKAFASAMKTLDDGIDDTGPAGELGPEWVVAIDSLWAAGQAAFLEHGKLQPTKDSRQTYGGAQQMLMGMLKNLTDPDFKAHVIVITHMNMVELESGQVKGVPAAIGKAITTEIPKLFNRMLVVEVKGAGKNARRVISTVPTSLIPAASGEAPGKIPAELPVETGLADFFAAVLGEKENE